jgi:hypothetical protein
LGGANLPNSDKQVEWLITTITQVSSKPNSNKMGNGNSISYNSMYVAINATPGSETLTAWTCVVMEPTGGLQLCAKSWTLGGKIYAATGLLDEAQIPLM